MGGKWGMIVLFLVIGYFIGVMWPSYGNKVVSVVKPS